jgi:hypothetical protein
VANRRFNNQQFTMLPGVVSVHGRVTFGSTGSPTLDQTSQNSMGIFSVTRNSAGNYTFVFGSNAKFSNLDTYFKTLNVSCVFNTVNSGGGAPAAPLMCITTSSIAIPNVASTTIQFLNTSGAATDPASGEILHIEFTFRNSSAP